MSGRSTVPVVAIVGGGFTGAALAYHLVQKIPDGAARIIVFEPRQILGGGLAYDTSEAVHRINVPAARMSLIPGDDEHFQRWLLEGDVLRDDPEAVTPDGHMFARRGVFGRYVHAHVAPFLANGRVEHHRSRVLSIAAANKAGWRVEAEDGSALLADIVVLATTHPSPQAPSVLARTLAAHPRYVADTTVDGALSPIRADDRVLVVGSGLTAADVIAALDASGHRGPMTAVSRRGLRSRGHHLLPQDPFGDFASPPSRTALALLKRTRSAITEAEAQGISWHAIFDKLRVQGGEIWRQLPIAERRRLVRLLRPYWDVHRFRIAPQVEGALERLISAGRLSFQAASITGAQVDEDGEISVRLRHRHGKGVLDERYDAVVITTGPGHAGILSSQPFLAGLAADGRLHPDQVGLGIEVDAESRAIGEGGQANKSLYIAGPLARGTFGELMGLPQVTEHAVFVADRVAGDVRTLARLTAAHVHRHAS